MAQTPDFHWPIFHYMPDLTDISTFVTKWLCLRVQLAQVIVPDGLPLYELAATASRIPMLQESFIRNVKGCHDVIGW